MDRPSKVTKRTRDQDSSSPVTSSSWRDVASALIEFVDCKKVMVCIDLDHTIWNTSCFEHTSSPYELFEESDPSVKSVSYTSRQDRERCVLSLYPDVYEILDWCREKGIKLTICSKSQQSEAARGILTAMGIWSLFQFPQIYNRRKSTHFKQLKECTDLEYENFLFFDDDAANIEMSSALGVVAEKVNPTVGLTKETFLRGLTSFTMKHMAMAAVAALPMPIPVRSSSSGSSTNSDIMSVTPPIEVTGLQYLNCSNLYRPYQSPANPNSGDSSITVSPAESPAGTSTRASQLPPLPFSSSLHTAAALKPGLGLIPHRMSGIQLDNYKGIMPLDMSSPRSRASRVHQEQEQMEPTAVSDMMAADVSDASASEPEDEHELDHELVLSF